MSSGAVKVEPHWHSATMPHKPPADTSDPSHYPDPPSTSEVQAITFVPVSGRYLLHGICHLAILWLHTGVTNQKDLMTIELCVGDPRSTFKSFMTAPSSERGTCAVVSLCEARLGPWMLLCVLAVAG
jgi:hypothetical protein